MIDASHNRWKLPCQSIPVYALIISAFFVSGCNPGTNTETPSPASNSLSLSTGAPLGQSTVTQDPPGKKQDENRVSITGDLNAVDWQSHVGKQIMIEGDLVIVDTYDLARRGQIKVARNRLLVPTSQVDPNDADPTATSSQGNSNVAKVIELQETNDRGSITVDDGRTEQNVFPLTLFPEIGKTQPSVRVGSIVHGLSGRLTRDRNRLIIQTDKPLVWSPAVRPERPGVGEADLTIASFNVLNYFTTIDNGRNGARGADSESELGRQEAKITAAISGLQADVIGLMEMENNIEAEKRLVGALNRKLGDELYTGCGIPEGFKNSPGGTDSIRVGIIYRADRVSPVGNVSMIVDDAFARARTPIVQTFMPKDGGKPFTVIVNHFKSKGGGSNANAANRDKKDGQAAYNQARREQALAICDYIDQVEKKNPESRILVIGDLNAYQQEDPIDVLRDRGLVDLQEQSLEAVSSSSKNADYSFIYFGQCGNLDHAFANRSLAKDVTGTSIWHINADEPRFLDYNEEFNPATLYNADAYRSSDHDPVLIGIQK